MSVRARVVLVEDGRVALIERRRAGERYFLFPGGGVEAGESFLQAAIREAWEELGVRVELGDVIYDEEFGDARFVYFAARIVGGEFGTGAWPDHAARTDVARERSSTCSFRTRPGFDPRHVPRVQCQRRSGALP